MAPSLTDGVPGIEGVWTLTPPSPAAPFTLNDFEDPATGLTLAGAAYTRLQSITGLHDKPDSDDPRVSLNFQTGELAFPRLQRGRTITYTGVVVGPDFQSMRAHVAALRALASSGGGNPTAWVLGVAYDPTLDPTGLAFVATAIPLAFTCDDVQQDSRLQRGFVLTMRQADGRWHETSTPQTASAADGSPATLTMSGTAPSDPVFTVTGSGGGASSVVITNATLGWTWKVDLAAAMGAGDVLVVDFGQRSAILTPNAGAPANVAGYVDWSATDAWNETLDGALVVGANVLQVNGDPWQADATSAVW